VGLGRPRHTLRKPVARRFADARRWCAVPQDRCGAGGPVTLRRAASRVSYRQSRKRLGSQSMAIRDRRLEQNCSGLSPKVISLLSEQRLGLLRLVASDQICAQSRPRLFRAAASIISAASDTPLPPSPTVGPPAKPPKDRLPVTEAHRQVAPRCAGSHQPKHRVERAAMIAWRPAAAAMDQERFEARPLIVGHQSANQSCPPQRAALNQFAILASIGLSTRPSIGYSRWSLFEDS
jgi:hypothetical protein